MGSNEVGLTSIMPIVETEFARKLFNDLKRAGGWHDRRLTRLRADRRDSMINPPERVW